MIAQLNTTYIRTRPGRLFPRLLSYFFFEGRPVTTAGRWFNPITIASLKRAARAEVIPATEKPVFITGTGRSGTTVLGVILSIHPEIGFLNEPKALWHQVHPNDDLIGSYSAVKGHYFLSSEDATAEQARKAKGMYSSFLNLSGASVVLDKYPEMIFRTGYLEKLFGDPKFIFLHRNPWDTIASTAEWSNIHGNATEDWWGVNGRKWRLLVEQVVPHDPELQPFLSAIGKMTSQNDMAAVEWIVTMNQALQRMDAHPGRFLQISYEKLVADPVSQLKAICDFAGIDHDAKMLEYGSRMLRARQRNEKPVIDPLLVEPLRKTAARLGYSI